MYEGKMQLHGCVMYIHAQCSTKCLTIQGAPSKGVMMLVTLKLNDNDLTPHQDCVRGPLHMHEFSMAYAKSYVKSSTAATRW